MTREQIEKAANIEMLSHYADDEYPCGIKDIQSDFIEAFSKGAQWRINSVWHDAETEMPRENEPIIGITDKRWCYMGVCGETAKEICPEMAKWAYVADLMPERKEGTE